MNGYDFNFSGMSSPYTPSSSGIATFGSSGQGTIGAAPVAAPGAPVVPASVIEAQALSGASGVDPTTGMQTGQTGGFFSKLGGLEGLGSIAQGIASIGQIFAAFQQLKLAKEQFAFTKDAYNTNLENSTQSYNTQLEDRINARFHQEGKSQAAVDQYLNQHSL